MRTITRNQAIEELRMQLLKLVDEQTSLCLVAARRGLFCTGFARWSQEELEKGLPLAPEAPEPRTRASVVREANDWQLSLQDRASGRLPCDVGNGCRSPFCAGWDQFSEAEIELFHREMCGQDVRVVPDGAGEPPEA